jgi:hypothetical protein
MTSYTSGVDPMDRTLFLTAYRSDAFEDLVSGAAARPEVPARAERHPRENDFSC